MKAKSNTEILKTALADFFKQTDFAIETVQGGASSRKYYTIEFVKETYFPNQTILVMDVPLEDIDILVNYMNVDYYLQRMKIPTPRLYEIYQPKGWVFLEYITDPTLEEFFHTNPGAIETVLPDVLRFIQQMQKKCLKENHCPAFHRRFDFEKYMFEFNFHVKEQLLGFYFHPDYDQKLVDDFAREISTVLDIDYPLFSHRDFQSSNIFIKTQNQRNEFIIIDFQDARYGTPVYDVVSCLWDSYIPVSADFRAAMIKDYFRFLPELEIDWGWEYYQKLVDYSVIQRKLHDAGAFAYNYRRFGSKRYVKYIREAIDMAIDCMKNYRHFSKAIKFFEALKRESSP